MDSAEFRQRGREMVDYIVEYMETLGERRVTPSVQPGYLREMIPKNAPHEESKIMPGVRIFFFFMFALIQIMK